MIRKKALFWLAALLVTFSFPADAADSAKSEEIIGRHLDAIATPAVRTSIKSRVVEGATIYKILAGGTGSAEGKAVLASEGDKTRYLLKVSANTYHGEQIIYDGKRSDVAATYSDKTRSELANFLRAQDAPIREGLLGGVLTTAWPPLQPDSAKRLTYDGLKKVDGTDLLAFRYHTRKGTDLEIFVFFDPATFRHVRTSYRAGQSAPVGFNDVESAHRTPTRYLLTEEFSQFQSIDGVTFPAHYVLRFRSEVDALIKEVEWDVSVGKILNNISMDPRNFEIK
jgi:hypothetical protein